MNMLHRIGLSAVVVLIGGILPSLLVAQEQTLKGEISNVNPRAVYKVKMEAGKPNVIDLMSKDFDTYLEVLDSNGKKLAEDDDGGDELNSRLAFVPKKTDTYQVVARAFGGGKGAFTLIIRPAQFAATGQLTENDPKDRIRKNAHHKVHVVKLEAGKQYQVDLTSKKFDTYLRIEDAQGKDLEQDDDGGEGLNSRIVFRPAKTGDYRIIVTAFGGSDVGPYMVMVGEK